MERDAAAARFQEASRAFKANSFSEAISILRELLVAFPNDPAIIHAMAVARARIGQHDEATKLAIRLRDELHDPKGQGLIDAWKAAAEARAEEIRVGTGPVSDTVSAQCPHCGNVQSLNPKLTAKRVYCHQCNKTFDLRQSSGPEAAGVSGEIVGANHDDGICWFCKRAPASPTDSYEALLKKEVYGPLGRLQNTLMKAVKVPRCPSCRDIHDRSQARKDNAVLGIGCYGVIFSLIVGAVLINYVDKHMGRIVTCVLIGVSMAAAIALRIRAGFLSSREGARTQPEAYAGSYPLVRKWELHDWHFDVTKTTF